MNNKQMLWVLRLALQRSLIELEYAQERMGEDRQATRADVISEAKQALRATLVDPDLYQAALAAAAAWHAELHRAFGKQAGDMRYQPAGKGAPGSALRAAFENWHRANDAWRASIRARDGGDAIRANTKRIADRVDGYDRDDLGESPDY